MERCTTLVSVSGAVADGAHEAPVDAGASAHLTDGHGVERLRGICGSLDLVRGVVFLLCQS